MSSWRTRTVEDVCTRITSGGTPSRRVPEYFQGDIPWLKTQELRDGWVYETEEHISDSAVANSSANLLPQNTVMMAMYGATVGKLAILGRSMTCNQAACAMIVNPGEADFRFLYYALLNARTRIIDLANGAAQQNLSARTIKSLELTFPPLQEQKVIAATLSALDDKIDSNLRIATQASALVDSLMSKLLASVETESRPLSELVAFNRLSVKPFTTEALKYIDISSVSPGHIESTMPLTWDQAPSRARRGVGDGDVIFSTVRPGRRSFALVLDPEADTVVSTGFAVMTPGPHLGSSMLTCVVGSQEFAEYLESVAQGSAYPAVSIQAMGNYVVTVPKDIAVVERFEAATMPLRRRAAHAEKESVCLKTLRDSILPELLSGRIRVPLEGDAE